MKSKRVVILLFILWTIGLVFLLLTPGSAIPNLYFFENQDKVIHLILFSGWCLLFYLVLNQSSIYAAITVLVTGLFLAAMTEWLQAYIPYRTADIADFYLDLSGIGIGVFLGFFLKKELIGRWKKFDS